MDLVKSEHWVEVRPLITSELASANFAPVLDVLYNLAKPYRFLVVDTKDSEVCDRRLVRFYLQFSDEPTRKQVSNIIKTLLDVEVVVVAEPSREQYLFSVDLALAKNYALPILWGSKGCQDKVQVNLIDRLVASLAGLGACVEVTAQADPNAVLGAQKFIYAKSSPKSSVGKAFFDSFFDVAGEAARKDQGVKGKAVSYLLDSWVRECVANAEVKGSSSLFTCRLVVRGDSLRDVLAIKNALPAGMNRFRVFKTEKKPHQQVSALRAPSRYGLRNQVFCRLWWVVPLSILLFAGCFGFFNPLNLVSLGFSLDLVFVGVVVFLAVCLFVAFRKRQPIVLGVQELAQIIGLPTAIAKLPVMLGKVPVSRMQLGFGEVTEEKSKNKIQSFNQEEKASETGQKADLSDDHRLGGIDV
ncbi:MAG: hypothetical protein LBH62_07820 [Nitrososphaerota archaeon]|jgi:hypothetical protein|nr:hypothetical protein [Nitrososphaerota archaeon]